AQMRKAHSSIRHRSRVRALCLALIVAVYTVSGTAAELPDCKHEPQECTNVIGDLNRLISGLEVEKGDLTGALSSVDIAPLGCGSVAAPSGPSPQPPSSPIPYETYKITSNRDNLWKIAELKLHDGNRYPEIVAFNNRMLDYGAVYIRFPDTVF